MKSTSEISNIFDFIANASVFFLVTFLLTSALIFWRTNSSHIFFTRVWIFFYGKSKHSVENINDFLDKQSAIMQFRFITGIKVQKLSHIDALITWLKRNDEAASNVSACGSFFDLELCQPQNVDKWTRIRQGIVWLVIYITFVISVAIFALAIREQALLKTKESGTWFWMDMKHAKKVGAETGLQFEKCTGSHENLAKQTNFSLDEVNLICAAAPDKETHKYLAFAIYSQRIMFSAAIIPLLYLTFLSLSLSRNISNTKELHKRLASRRPSDPLPDQNAGAGSAA